MYALIALGYTMVYGILRMINFAHGEIFMIGAFAGYFTAVALQNLGILNGSVLLSLISVGDPDDRRSRLLVAIIVNFWSSGSPTGRCATRRDWYH